MLPAEAPHLSTLSKISSFVIGGMVCSSETFYSMDAVERPPHLSPANSTLNKSVSAFTLEIFCSMDAASRGPTPLNPL